MSNGHENQDWISTAALLVVVQANRANGADSQDDSMAGFSLPQAGYMQDVSLDDAKHNEGARGMADGT